MLQKSIIEHLCGRIPYDASVFSPMLFQ